MLKMLCHVSKTAVKKGGSYRSEIFHISHKFHHPHPPYLIHLHQSQGALVKQSRIPRPFAPRLSWEVFIAQQ